LTSSTRPGGAPLPAAAHGARVWRVRRICLVLPRVA